MAKQQAITMKVNGDDYQVWFPLAVQDALLLRTSTGLSQPELLSALGESPDLDLVVVMMWLARRQRGEKIPFSAVAGDVDYDCELEVVPTSDGDHPEA